ncbi:MAG: UDP-N-acetylmuramoyl-L-alanyl-D-glutamate--2,6-diaminopimelate ligase [Victivallaceae bacterium]|nr:UDP-N-acetylmuramoyl-L-alanyl-D-glutamate--2,6-diaminopimelate ligase [Victivallaceae bacterium]
MTVLLKKIKEYLGELIVEERNRLPESISGCGVKTAGLGPGSMFIAFDDEENDGVEHIPDAVECGAAVIAATVPFDDLPEAAKSVGYLRIARPTLFAARAAELFAGFPADRLRLYSITGTNGKTTSAMLMHNILERHYGAAGLISTVGCRCGKTMIQTGYTTPPPFVTQELFAEMVRCGIHAAALENSSHGLDQFRTSGALFDGAIFTNLTGDHLDYHKTMDNYYAAKRRMFTELVKPGRGAAVINIDDPWGARLLKEVRALGIRSFGFGRSAGADYRIGGVDCSSSGTKFTLLAGRFGAMEVAASLCGEHNVYNMTGVLAAALETGIPAETVLAAFASGIQVPGRLERISDGRIDCFVDYAHTDDALERVLTAVRPWCRGRLIVVFGCGGNRDRGKRPRMGRAAATLADVAVVTSDNPRGEKPGDIIADILPGTVGGGAEILIEPDRRRAIEMALSGVARPGDIVLIAGKGHENYQEINGKRSHMDDREEARKWLGKEH